MAHNKKLKRTKIEFIKSAALLLLAIVLLISAVVAWFGDFSEVSIDPFTMSIDSDTGDLWLGDGAGVVEDIVLPAATIIDDVTAAELSKVLYVVDYTVHAAAGSTATVDVTAATGLHYYIDTNYDSTSDTMLSYASAIKQESANDKSAEFTLNSEGECDVAVVFWADYPLVDGKAVVNSFNEDLTYEVLIQFAPKQTEASA